MPSRFGDLRILLVAALAVPLLSLGACAHSRAAQDFSATAPDAVVAPGGNNVAAGSQETRQVMAAAELDGEAIELEIEQAMAGLEIDLEAMELEIAQAMEAAEINRAEIDRMVAEAQAAAASAAISDEEIERIIEDARRAAEEAATAIAEAFGDSGEQDDIPD